MRTLSRCVPLAVLIAGMAIPAVATPLVTSYTGTFLLDNHVELLPFTVLTDSMITLQTFSYGGGINFDGNLIAKGGFEPMLQLFTNPGGIISSNVMTQTPAPCAPRQLDPDRLNTCFDVYAQVLLTAGDYWLALTQNPNSQDGFDLSGGFVFDIGHDPTQAFNDNHFAGSFGPGDGHWALDLTIESVPEPTSALLTMSALMLAGLGIRKRAR